MANSERKIALVTGGGKGIGAAIAITLAQSGFDIWLNYRSDHDAANLVKNEIEQAGGQCLLLPFDVADIAACENALKPYLENATPFAIINNAGFAKDTLLALMSSQEWNDVISVHLGGFFNVTRQVLPQMLRKRCGRVINIVSTSGQTGVGGQTNYSAAKAGMIGATRSLAMEVAKRKILVNAVAPGFIETEMTEELPLDKILPMVPLGRIGKAQEVADMVDFLCSDKAEYITGQVFSVNGGACMP
ncbi:3-oxoacyl-ACP reductase FabG [Desulfuromonas acetoxidans]|uniref:Short-chain dehydrogenase/reductase SDR n=1 Tax=Desulfuromonas acetoxidans (strain DSM 684 / 11070) TaxID=281689 RepID=Q1K0P3_DESA6|nr:3-oxoacyl-ACP reductase FabG [Desulfuromonas acetoxidans]EAT15898.1 short-chain dehydrogenase/reductase SDR [Desulfuromonas acetoxidans DSM 684]MBF0644204.1 3-oxoacyl-ACP reductase FabG [Desulfuromonas acetoxidans]NVD24498.1 3-oxoacyl-ACP reductase FabG [Desulfuromonas acetoxidans]NVE16552.1 3-oxoacyl-ACP reductase FabG [Desulfuromonas acetoxidans]